MSSPALGPGVACAATAIPFDVLLIELAEPYLDLMALRRLCLIDTFHNTQLPSRLRYFNSDSSNAPSATLAPTFDSARAFLHSLSSLKRLKLHCTKLGPTPLPPSLSHLTLIAGALVFGMPNYFQRYHVF